MSFLVNLLLTILSTVVLTKHLLIAFYSTIISFAVLTKHILLPNQDFLEPTFFKPQP
jgi:hypothetical protein